MKFNWMVLGGALLAAGTAGAQPLPYPRIAPYALASDFDGPYAAMPPEALPPGYYAPRVLPPQAIYEVLREAGYSPLGAPQQRGLVYTIAALDPDGEDGRLVIDARTGRILRFMSADRMGGEIEAITVSTYGRRGLLPPMTDLRRPPRPPMPVPRVASRSVVPLPKPMPPRAVAAPTGEAKADVKPELKPEAKPEAKGETTPAAPQQAAAQPAPAPAAAAPAAAAKPPVVLQPTQEMPAAQGLD
jgi:hypothetical protein